VFVTEDGAETDLDLGHYERFINVNLNKYSNLTSGKVYWNVLNRERKGEYLGQTVQVIPHITEEIKKFIYMGAESSDCDVLITEIGGTTGDIESQPFLEAIRQVSLEKGRENCCFIHVTLVPWLSGSNEHKSKPTQHSVKELQSLGISPDVIVCRVDHPLEQSIKDKISLFCNVPKDCVIENSTCECLYEAPLMLHRNGLDKVVRRRLNLGGVDPEIQSWEEMVAKIGNLSKTVNIALVGKYVQLHDAYLSVREALLHGGYANDAAVEVFWIDSEEITSDNVSEKLAGIDGIIVPGGFGDRGIEGMITTCQYARENDIPYFGICLGMQIAAIEFARNVCGLEGANSGEFNPGGKNLVIDLMEEQMAILRKGGTMRLGAYPCKIAEGTRLYDAYQETEISERHRHRFEFNNQYRDEMKDAGLTIGGTSPDEKIVESVEVTENKFHLGVQFHPEFKSRPNKPHPLFVEFIKSSLK
ncbi:MAG: CTP synthase, partial [Pseudobutyrivibrio sp.]|nr:CTP synthase [Pseudobutyrivibrio sp.]